MRRFTSNIGKKFPSSRKGRLAIGAVLTILLLWSVTGIPFLVIVISVLVLVAVIAAVGAFTRSGHDDHQLAGWQEQVVVPIENLWIPHRSFDRLRYRLRSIPGFNVYEIDVRVACRQHKIVLFKLVFASLLVAVITGTTAIGTATGGGSWWIVSLFMAAIAVVSGIRAWVRSWQWADYYFMLTSIGAFLIVEPAQWRWLKKANVEVLDLKDVDSVNTSQSSGLSKWLKYGKITIRAKNTEDTRFADIGPWPQSNVVYKKVQEAQLQIEVLREPWAWGQPQTGGYGQSQAQPWQQSYPNVPQQPGWPQSGDTPTAPIPGLQTGGYESFKYGN